MTQLEKRLLEALKELLVSHSMENVGLEASKRRLAAKRKARDLLKELDSLT